MLHGLAGDVVEVKIMVDHIRHVLETEADDNLWSAGHEDSQMDEF